MHTDISLDGDVLVVCVTVGKVSKQALHTTSTSDFSMKIPKLSEPLAQPEVPDLHTQDYENRHHPKQIHAHNRYHLQSLLFLALIAI